jgi:dihydrofolate reductase
MTTTVPPAAGPAAAIGKVTADISMSLDGFTTGPNDTPQKPLGEGGNRLHAWLEGLGDWGERPDLTGPHADVFRASHAHVGAAVMGRRVFNNGVAPWGDNPPFHVPVFVVTHQSESAPGQGGRNDLYLRHRGHRARPRAGASNRGDKDVLLGGGAKIVRQFIDAGLLDELQIHLVPVLLGDGIRLFDRTGPRHLELACTEVVEAPGVTHLRYRILK